MSESPPLAYEDFALVIQVSSYPQHAGPPLPGANADQILRLLTDASGAIFPMDNAYLLRDAGASSAAIQSLSTVLEGRFREAQGSLRRFYLYASGYGLHWGPVIPSFLFAPSDSTLDEPRTVDLSEIEYVARPYFDELVFIADCDWSTARSAYVGPDESRDSRMGEERSILYLANGLEDQPGQLTSALIKGLSGAALGPDGGPVTARSLIDYIGSTGVRPRWNSFGGEIAFGPSVFGLGQTEIAKEQPPNISSSEANIGVVGQFAKIASDRAEDESDPQPAPGRSQPTEPLPTAGPPATTVDWVPALSDAPAVVDRIGRRPFAEVIGMRMQEAWAEQRGKTQGEQNESGPEAFVINLHGPWGSGKTSVLNFLRADLKDTTRPTRLDAELAWTRFSEPTQSLAHTKVIWRQGYRWSLELSDRIDALRDELRRDGLRELGEPSRPWVVVQFNAWRSQRLRPPWWALLTEVERQAIGQVPRRRAAWLRTRSLVWRIRADWMPALAAAGLIALALLLATGAFGLPILSGAEQAANVGQPGPTVQLTAPATPRADELAKSVELGFKVVTAGLAAAAGLLALSRSLIFGSSAAALAYATHRADPFGPVMRLFNGLIGAIKQPVAVFIDDLDRCEPRYVVELLEGIQTMFRSAPLVYVVASDRRWISTSYEVAYPEYSAVGETGRPLGYLFLEKIFQVSAPIPRLTAVESDRFFKDLLTGAGAVDAQALEDEAKKEQAVQAENFRNKVSQDAIEETLNRELAATASTSNPREAAIKESAIRAAAALQITSEPVQKSTENELQPFAAFLEPNPRAMKLFVNTYSLVKATHYLERRTVDRGPLARWTIVQLRWPLLAEELASRPELIRGLMNERASSAARVKELCDYREARRVVGRTGDDALTESALLRIVADQSAPGPPSPRRPGASAGDGNGRVAGEGGVATR